MARRTLDELIGDADRYADIFESYQPTEADRTRQPDGSMALKLAAFRRSYAERELAQAVEQARTEHLSWRQIGSLIGTSGEAARQRYGHAS